MRQHMGKVEEGDWVRHVNDDKLWRVVVIQSPLIKVERAGKYRFFKESEVKKA